jgi:hypothetical protein
VQEGPPRLSALGALGGEFVELAVDLFVAQNGLDVFASFGEGDGLYKFVDAMVVADALPIDDAVISGVVSGKGVFGLATEFLQGLFQIKSPEADVR